MKIFSYVFSHKEKDELIKRLKEELYDMCGTCSTGFASRLINVLSGYDDFNIKISFIDQIVSNFIARVNHQIQKITDKDSIYFNEKARDIVWIYMKNKKFVPKEIKNETMDTIIDKYLSINPNEKIRTAVEDFADNILIELMNTNNYINRPYFIKFFRDTVPILRQELYEEFKDYVDDTDFDLSIRRAIDNYESAGYY